MKPSTNDTTRYVGINEPQALRKTVLEASRGILRNLQLYEDIKEIERQKLDVAGIFEKELKDIYTLIRKLKKELPKLPGKQEIIPKTPKRTPKNITELERELQAIEQSIA